MNTDYEREEITWDGITIEVGWAPEYFSIGNGKTMGHLEIASIKPDRAPLPMTETGYRSHWLQPEEMDEYGGALNYVEAWLAHAAKSKDWLERKAAFDQLELF